MHTLEPLSHAGESQIVAKLRLILTSWFAASPWLSALPSTFLLSLGSILSSQWLAHFSKPTLNWLCYPTHTCALQMALCILYRSRQPQLSAIEAVCSLPVFWIRPVKISICTHTPRSVKPMSLLEPSVAVSPRAKRLQTYLPLLHVCSSSACFTVTAAVPSFLCGSPARVVYDHLTTCSSGLHLGPPLSVPLCPAL